MVHTKSWLAALALLAISMSPLAVATPAHAAIATPDPVSTPIVAGGTTVTSCDSQWKNCTSTSSTFDPHALYAASGQTISGPGGAFGCRWVDVWVTESSFFGAVAYRYHNYTSWCWAYGVAIYNQGTFGYMDSADGLHQLTNQNNVHYFYSYAAGWPQSGWYSMWRGQVSNCFWTACGGVTYPWVEVRAHVGGSYYRSWGV